MPVISQSESNECPTGVRGPVVKEETELGWRGQKGGKPTVVSS